MSPSSDPGPIRSQLVIPNGRDCSLKALVISERFPPSSSPEAIVTAKFVAALSQAGVDSHVICGLPGGTLDTSRCWDSLLPEPQRVAGDEHLLGTRVANTIARLKTLYAYAQFWTLAALKAAEETVQKGHFDLILTRTLPEDSMLVGYHLWRKTGIPWIAYFGDPPRSMFPFPYGPRRRSWKDYPALLWLRRVLPGIPLTVFPSQRLLNYYRDVLGIPIQDNAVVIPHIGWKAQRSPCSSAPAPRRCRIMHIGALHACRRIDDVLAGLASALKSVPPGSGMVELLFVGSVPADVIRRVEEAQLSNTTTILPEVSFEQSLRLMSEADALLLVEARLAEGVFLPSKFCDYAASGKPILMYSPEHGTVADVVDGHNHPGFMGQTSVGAERVFLRLIDAVMGGSSLDEYCVPCDEFQPDKIAARFLEEIACRLGLRATRAD